MVVLGIDPGVCGALAVIDTTLEETHVFDMPVSVRKQRTTRRGEAKTVNIRRFDPLALDMIWRSLDRKPDVVYLERMSPRPTDGPMQAWRLAQQYGEIRGLLIAYGARVVEVRPQDWQKLMLCRVNGSDTKARSYEVACRMFPCLELTGPRGGVLDGRCDALLIAAYGVRCYRRDAPK